MDGHVAYVKAPERVIEGLNGGSRYHVDYDMQDYVWEEFFDEGGRRYPLLADVLSRIED